MDMIRPGVLRMWLEVVGNRLLKVVAKVGIGMLDQPLGERDPYPGA
jgi:hypothetical protein